MSRPPGTLHEESLAEQPPGAVEAPRPVNPDDPPWGVPAALGVWLASIVLMALVPLFLIIPYVIYRFKGAPAGTTFGQIDEALRGDPTVLLIGVAATIPTHLATVAIVWVLVTGLGRRPFWQHIGWGWGRRFGFWTSVLAAFGLLAAAFGLANLLGVRRTPFDDLLESSAAALFTTAFLATATAPLVEELVYRGTLYPALRRATGVAPAVLLVTFLFALVHFWQYKTSPGTIAAILLLSLALTVVRAATGRVLPCIVIHLVFNGVQVAGLLYGYFRPERPAEGAAAGLLSGFFLF